MALDGLVISNLTYELAQALTGGRINKIYQPEPDALVLTVKNQKNTYRLLLSASASLPLIYLMEETPANPASAPNFCMLLRKHIGGGKITAVTQPGLERIIHFHIEHLDEMGDLRSKVLIAELMGKHSNIIFCRPEEDGSLTIIDSIKHISANISSVREVLPGRKYFIAQTMEKLDPLTLSEEDFISKVLHQPLPIAKAIYTSVTGISPLIAEELCFRAGIDSSSSTSALTDLEKIHLARRFSRLMEDITRHSYHPNIVYDGRVPVEFSCTTLSCYGELEEKSSESISVILREYYAARNAVTRIRQKSADLRKITATHLERSRKKYQIQLKQMEDTKKKEKYRIYGEMINTYGYSLEPGADHLTCENYYNGQTITVPLDPQLSAHDNSLRYFERYAKLKRTYEAVSEQIEETRAEIEHLESIQTSLDIASDEADLYQIRQELADGGFLHSRPSGGRGKQKQKIVSRPLHYISSDGYHIYVGKNNYQNEELSFKLASGSDWWFHAKGIPGSHVIVRCEGKEPPISTFEDAGRLAAYYSKGKNAEKVEIDYIQKKHLRKPPAARPGFVIYHTNYSMMIEPDISGIQLVKE